MMYTSVEEYKGKIYLTEVKEENGKPITSFHVIDDFKPSIYVEANTETNIKGFPYNTDLQKITFDSIREFKEYNYKMKNVDNRLYGNIEAQFQYINDMYNKSDNTLVRFWMCDIETEVPKGNFPSPETEEITYIQIYDNTEDSIYIISTTRDYEPNESDVKYIKCDTERELLDMFLKLYYNLRPSTVTGINFVHFDTNFIIKRLDILKYQKNILSPFGKSYKHRYKKFNKDFEIELPIGVTWIDYMDIVDTHAYLKLGGKSLDVLANKVLGDTKLNWKRYAKSFYDLAIYKYTPPFDITSEEKEETIYKAWLDGNEEKTKEELHKIFTEYSILDVRLLKEIDKKLGMINVMYNYSWAMGCNPYNSLKTVIPWDTFLYGRLKAKNKITASFFGDDEKYKIAGGYWNATPGLHKAIASFDFNSQYPIGDATLNICPSTHIRSEDVPKELQELVKPLQKYRDSSGVLQDREDNMLIYLDFPEEKKERIVELLTEYNFTMSPNGSFFTKDFKGEVPILIEEVYNQRVQVKKLMKQAFGDGDKDLGNIYNIQQMILKIIINSLYGYLASKYFKLGSADLGAAITAFGRFSLITKKNCVNEIHKNITGKDIICSNLATDAVYFVFDEIIKKKYKNPTPKETTDLLIEIIDKVIQPNIDKNIENDFRLMNGYVNLMASSRECIATHGLVTGISKYALRVTNDEGKDLIDKPKMKIIGMPNIAVSTPKKVAKALDETINIIFDKDNNSLIKYINEYKKEFCSYLPSEISQLTGVSSIEKYKDSTSSIYWVSKASIIYNKLLQKMNLEDEFDLVGENDKVMLIYLKNNPITRADVLAYKEDTFLFKTGLNEYIDYDRHFKALFLDNIQRFTDTVGWETKKSGTIKKLF